MNAEVLVAENVHGPEIRADGTVRFRLWAPALERIELEIIGRGQPGPYGTRR